MFDVDPYDDGRSLLNKQADKNRERLQKLGEDLSSRLFSLADGQFALVMFTPEDPPRKFRKYACVDTGNVVQNIGYFLERNSCLPAEAIKVAAQNLLIAAQDFGIEPPEELTRLAGSDPVDTNAVLLDYRDTKVAKELTAKCVRESSPEMSKSTMTGKAGPDEKLVLPTGIDEKKEKHLKKFPELLKKGSMTLHNLSDVQDAVQLYRDSRPWLTGWEKRAFAQMLVEGAPDFLAEIPAEIQKYASSTYDDGLGTLIIFRQLMLPSVQPLEKAAELRLAYRDLFQEKDNLEPLEFATKLEALDESTGLSKVAAVPDAIYSTFGQKKPDLDTTEKPLFTYAGVSITSRDLKRFVDNFPEWIKNKFGEKVLTALGKDTDDVFLSLPLPQKRAILNAAFREGGHVRTDGEIRNP